MSDDIPLMTNEEWEQERMRVSRMIFVEPMPYSCSIDCQHAHNTLDRNCVFADQNGEDRLKKCPHSINTVKKHIRDRQYGLLKTKW